MVTADHSLHRERRASHGQYDSSLFSIACLESARSTCARSAPRSMQCAGRGQLLVSHPRKFYPRKSVFCQIREKFAPRKFPAIRYVRCTHDMCDLAMAMCTSRIVALKALLTKQTNGGKLSTLSDVKAMVEARYQLEPAARSQRAHYVLRSSHGESTSGSLLSRHYWRSRLMAQGC